MSVRKIFISFFLVVLAMAVLAILCRNILLTLVLDRVTSHFEAKYHAHFSIQKAEFEGLSDIRFTGLSVKPVSGDTLLTIHSIRITPAYVKLLLGKISYSRMEMDEFFLRLHQADSISNFSFLSGKNAKPMEAVKVPSPFGYGERMNSLFNRIFELITGETSIRNLRFQYDSPETKRIYHSPNFFSNGKNYECTIYNLSQEDTIHWNVTGKIDKKQRGITFLMNRVSSNATMVSLTNAEKSASWLLDTLYFEATGMKYAGKEMLVGMKGFFRNFQLNYWRVSPENVVVSSGNINFLVRAGPGYMNVDSSSMISLNKFTCRIGIGYDLNEGKKYSLRIRTGNFPASDLFESLPGGMFSNLQGIKAKGELNYRLDFSLNTVQPDSLVFISELKKEKFLITQFGNDYLPRINEEFQYTAFDKDRPLRTFSVGPSNPAFTPLDQISPYLKYAVMTSEDGGFFLHGGFNEESFRQSIATNVKEGRFARGGSTISMQLVKNVYLSRDKTISRKLEEALIVWLIEKNRLVSKDRMFEVYLNIIEWGPNIYGIKEASEFYFSKHPIQLTLAESIFLASIIPHPKYFMYSFDKSTGQLKPFLNGFYRLVSDRMMRKNWITEEDLLQLTPVVKLNGPALNFVITPDSIQSDSIPLFEPDQIN